MNINLVAAVALNGVIGDSITNSIPWKIPGDLKNFKAITTGKTVVMGRKTFESIGSKPLPNRRNIVITSNPHFRWRYKVPTYSSLTDAARNEDNDLYVIGGQRVYEEACSLCPTSFYITVVKLNPEGDVKFPFPGYKFIAKLFMPPSFVLYHCREQSEWIEENGFKYCFTHFSRNPPTPR